MEGHLVAGFDPIKKKHVGVWVDSMAPVMMHFEGDYDAATKTVTLHTEYPNPLTGQMEKFVLREVKTDANTRDWTMSMVMGDQEVPMMKSVYRRRAE
jgi:hypothetical protein